jgi:hypothetical protein
MIEKAREIEDDSEADSYVYVIESTRQFRRPKFPHLPMVSHFNRVELNNEEKDILDDFFTKVEDAGLNIDSSAYNPNYDNCFSFDEITASKILHIYREYPINGVVCWNNLYIPTWILLSFFVEGNVYYVGESDSSLTSRLKSHQNSETNFFKIHKPSNLVEVWDINYHEYDSEFDYSEGLFNHSISRGERIEKYLRRLTSNHKDMTRCLVYSN